MSAGSPLKILVFEWVTGGGLAGCPLPASLAAEGAAMRRAIAADFSSVAELGRRVQVTMTLDARLNDEPGPWNVERIDPTEKGGRIPDLARAADFTVLVAPETTGILARLTRELCHLGGRLLGSSAEAVELTGDKARLAARLEARGIETPRTRMIVPANGLPADAEYPAVIKPVDGAGSVDTFYVNDARRVPAGARAQPMALLQTFVPGAASSASYLVDDDGRAWLIGIGRQHVVIRNGRFAYLGGSLPAPWRHASKQVRRVVEEIAGLRGFVGVDFIWDDRRRHATVLEVNPRPTTSYVGLRALLAPGGLAEAWMAACGELPNRHHVLDSLADLVHGQRPISFNARGRLRRNRGVLQ
jgi:predicted ATP-grasp superfamily ATP-dependent carboligase